MSADDALAAALVAAFAFTVWRTARELAWLTRGRGAAALLAAALILAGMSLVWRNMPVRGGYDNEHDFLLLSTRGPEDVPLWLNGKTGNKEASPQLLFWVFDRLGGSSLSGVLAGQKALWLVNAALAAAAFLRLGAGWPAALLAAACVALPFLALITAHGFSTTQGNLFFVLAAVSALAELHAAEGDQPPLSACAAFAAAGLLVLAGRYELFPPLFLGAALAPWRRWRWSRQDGAVGAAIAVVGLAAAAAWALKLLQLTRYNGPRSAPQAVGSIVSNLAHHLGTNFLTPLTGVPPWAAAAAAAALIAWGLALSWRRRAQPRQRWPLFLALWAVYAAAIYSPLALYPLHFARHHLYVGLPLALLAAWGGARWPAGRPAAAALSIGLLVFAAANVRCVYALRTELRTNDLEWQHLLDARARWPSGCVVVGAVGYSRWALLTKYFPTAASTDNPACQLMYRSPNYQVMTMPGPNPRADEHFLGAPVLVAKLRHRFYTVWHGQRDSGATLETEEAKLVSFGFYELSKAAPD